MTHRRDRSALFYFVLFATVAVMIGGAAAIVSFEGGHEEPRGEPTAGPNILVIMADDQPATMLSTMPETRRLFVREGVSFTSAFATTPQCCPSRASILTGRYSHNHGVLGNTSRWVERLDTSTTIAPMLDGRGYRTALFGKFLNGWDIETPPPGFDRWAILRSDDPKSYYQNGSWNVDGKLTEIGGYHTDFIRDQALAFLRENEGSSDPWALFVWVTAPHAPPQPAPRHASADVPGRSSGPSFSEGAAAGKPRFVRRLAERYPPQRIKDRHRTLLAVDELVGAIFSELSDQGLADERTLAFYLSDNGTTLGEYGVATKGLPYLPSVRIPLMMRWPGHLPEDASSDALVANIDLAPTILDAAGIPLPGWMDGRSLLGDRTRRFVLLEHRGVPFKRLPAWASIVSRTHQYIEYYLSSAVRARELYDLGRDPHEIREAGGRHGPAIERWARLLDHYRMCRGVTCR